MSVVQDDASQHAEQDVVELTEQDELWGPRTRLEWVSFVGARIILGLMVFAVCYAFATRAFGYDVFQGDGATCKIYRRWEFKVPGYRGAHWILCQHNASIFGAAVGPSGRVLCTPTGFTKGPNCTVIDFCGHQVTLGCPTDP